MANANPKTAHLKPYQIQPGQILNPKGCGKLGLGALLKKIVAKDEVKGKIIGRLVSMAAGALQDKDALAAIKEVFDRVEGPLSTSLNVTGHQIQFNIYEAKPPGQSVGGNGGGPGGNGNGKDHH